MIGIRVFAWLCHVESCIAMCRFFPCRHCRLWFGVLFTVSTTSVKSADVSAVQRQVRYFCVQASQTDTLVHWQTGSRIQGFCNSCASSNAIRDLLWCFNFNQWLWSLVKMGACCSEFDGESYEAAGNLRNHSRWCSMMFDISKMFRLSDSWKKQDETRYLSILRSKIWFTSGFHGADFARKLVFPSELLISCSITRKSNSLH